MLENGMIVGASKYDVQDQPLQVCPVCLEDVGELIQTSEGWMCQCCADELIESNLSEYAPRFIAENRQDYLQGLFDWTDKDERKKALEVVFAFLKEAYPEEVESYTKAYLKDCDYELKEMVREELGIRWN